MAWLLIFALYSNGHLDTMQQVKFSTKEMCLQGASQIVAEFADRRDQIKSVCLALRKERGKKK
jgi:hypothetical protein